MTGGELAIAYRWALAPAGFSAFDVALVVACARGSGDAVLLPRVYHMRLPPRRTAYSLSDVSGTLGILWPTSDRAAEGRAAAFEKLVADAVMWLLDEYGSSDEMVVLVQGPMLPKLRGRLLYRAIAQTTRVYAVTYQPEWLKRIEAVDIAMDEPSGGGNARPKLTDVHPPMPVDAGTRGYMWYCAGRESVHFELVSNTWDPCVEGEWLSKRNAEIRELMNQAEPVGDASLPSALANATVAADGALLAERAYIAYCLSGGQGEWARLAAQSGSRSELLFAASDGKRGARESGLASEDEYGRFMAEWASKSDLIPRRYRTGGVTT